MPMSTWRLKPKLLGPQPLHRRSSFKKKKSQQYQWKMLQAKLKIRLGQTRKHHQRLPNPRRPRSLTW